MNAAHPKTKTFTTIEESQNNKIDTWKRNQDVIKGLEFIATMQLRTRIRVLLRHGEIHTDINTDPPKIAMEMWEGIWIPKTKTFSELGIDIDELPPGAHASSLGPIVAGDYLPFLVAIRKIIELNDSIENRIDKFREMISVCDWQEFLRKLSGIEKIVQYFFPRFINPMPKFSASTVGDLSRLGLDTPNRIAAASDGTLLDINGIGPAKLKAIREHCADMAKHRETDRVENVTR